MRKYEYETMEQYEKRMKRRRNLSLLNFVIFLVLSPLSIFLLMKTGVYNIWLYMLLPIFLCLMFLSDCVEVGSEINYQKELEFRKRNKK